MTSLRAILSIIAVSLLIVSCGGGETGSEATEAIPAGPITLTGGPVSITVDPANGARITSYKYQDKEVLNQDQGNNGLMFGSTVWTGPQEDWGWPPPAAFDTKPYNVVKVRDNVYLFTSEVDPESELRLEKRVQMTEAGEVGLRYAVINESNKNVRVGAWENTRLPYGGRFEFPIGDTAWSKVDPLPLVIKDSTAVIFLDEQNTEPAKVYASLRDTAVRYVHEGLIFTKQTMITGKNQVAEGQAPLEIYFDPENGFSEYELHGGVYTLQPAQRAVMRVKWTLRKE
ncbi:hypothetical protein [Lewinella sp. 4G2]|uniref:hypothetical protein n=1 Tax=Lewinella sp. 4G2 TaxID=1803372 RepID=UPI0007B4B18B|nr:hypothetical protein [Lewinella sp. 4G2]OAV44627.1 hypothetical protein A3850_009040 [Lewinella sp. 4G2]